MVRFETSLGAFTLELDAEKAPASVENFLSYVDDGFFDGLIFHRVIPGFMIQGGGMLPDMSQKKNKAPIKNEATNGLRNNRGTVAMARTNEINSATSQFFINLADNDFLNHSPSNYGYAVFGQVVEGMDTIDRIAKERTSRRKGHDDVPATDIMIVSAKRVEAGK
ncbi:MAG: peptidylprolyl isomerase [Steroidobacteraceae bacterium]